MSVLRCSGCLTFGLLESTFLWCCVQIPNPNPLATSPQPARAGTKLSLLSFSSRSVGPVVHKAGLDLNVSRAAIQSSIQEHPHEGRTSTDAGSAGSDGGDTSTACSTKGSSSAPAFGEGNSVLSGTSKDVGKRRKPKNNITKSSSSFISRCIVNENILRRLSDRPDNGYFAFANINRAFQWLDLSSPNKVCLSVNYESSNIDIDSGRISNQNIVH